MALGLEVLFLDLLHLLTLQPSLLLCRTPYRCIAQASTLNGSSASCATQYSRRSPVSGFYQMNPQWLPSRDEGQDTSVRELPKPEASPALPTFHDKLLPVFMSVTLSVPVVSKLLAAFPLALPTCVIEVRGIFWKSAGFQKICSVGVGSMSQAELGRVRLLWTEVDKDITSVLFSVYKSSATEFSD